MVFLQKNSERLVLCSSIKLNYPVKTHLRSQETLFQKFMFSLFFGQFSKDVPVMLNDANHSPCKRFLGENFV